MKKAEKYIDINIPIPRGKVNIGFSPSKKYFKFRVNFPIGFKLIQQTLIRKPFIMPHSAPPCAALYSICFLICIVTFLGILRLECY